MCLKRGGMRERREEKYAVALMSDSCPLNVRTHEAVRMSQIFAVASQAPLTNVCLSGLIETLWAKT